MLLRKAFLGVTVVVLALAGIGATRAAAVTVSGEITPADHTMSVVFITSPNCTGQGAAAVHYQAIRFYVTVSGTYTFRMLSTGAILHLYLHETAFNPASSFPTCIGADNSGNLIELTESLTALRQYIAVPFDDTFAQLGAFYTLTIEGPGAVVFGFADVPPGHFAEQFIDAVADANVTGGCGINPPVYCPDDVVTREQMAAFILRALGEVRPARARRAAVRRRAPDESLLPVHRSAGGARDHGRLRWQQLLPHRTRDAGADGGVHPPGAR
jgi:hypothetical protein